MSDYGLSKREKEILGLVSEDLTNNQIAETLFISIEGVRTHLRNIYKKLNIKIESDHCTNTLRTKATAIWKKSPWLNLK